MPYEWAFQSVGGGLAGIFLVLLILVITGWYRDLRGQITEYRSANKELRDAITRLTDTVESWQPEQQRRRLKRP